MTLRRDLDKATLALVGRVDPLTGDRNDADDEVALRAIMERIDALEALQHRNDRRLRARPRVLAGGTLGLAAVGAALTLALTAGGAAAPPAFAVTRQADGSVLVKSTTEAGFVGALQQLAEMGIDESFVPEFAPGAATVTGPVTCRPVPGSPPPSGPQVKVLLGTDGTQVFSPDQRVGSPGAGTWHMTGCMVFNPPYTGSGETR